MSYVVHWEHSALSALAQVLIRTTDRPRVTAAAHRIDALLSPDPTVGVSLTEGLYFLSVPPLRVVYEIDVPGRIVRITGVSWLP